MAELQLFNNNQLVRRYTLHQGGISIGRAPDNQIQLDSPAVDERHARVFTVGRSSVIQNLSADSGTYINDQEINRQTLRQDDVIQIGGFQLRYLTGEVVADSEAGRKQSLRTQTAAEHTPTEPDNDLQTEQMTTSEIPPPDAEENVEEPISVTLGAAETEPAPAEDINTKQSDTEIRTEAVKDALDEFESTLASEIDLDQIVDSRTLIETTGELSDPAPQTPGVYAARDPADEPQPVPDYGELTDEMATVLENDASASTEAKKKQAGGETDSMEQTVNNTVDAKLDTSSETEETATDHEEEDPVAAAIRARIQAKVNANARLQQETVLSELSADSVEESSAVAEDDTLVDDDIAQRTDDREDRPALVLDEQDEENTVLEFLPEPHHLTTAEQKIAAAKTSREAADKIEAPPTPHRDSAVELPTPPEWSLEGENSESTAGVLTVQGETDQGAQYGAVDIMHGPNAGLRVWLGKRRTTLGNHQDRTVIIERHPAGFRVTATHRGNTVTLNGTLLLSTPENLQDGDHIEFSNMGLKFVLTDVRPAHPNELAQDEEETAAPAPATPDAASQSAPDSE